MQTVLILIIVVEAIFGVFLFLKAKQVADRIKGTQAKIDSLERQVQAMKEGDIAASQTAVASLRQKVAVFEGKQREQDEPEKQILAWADQLPKIIGVFQTFTGSDHTNGKRRKNPDSAE